MGGHGITWQYYMTDYLRSFLRPDTYLLLTEFEGRIVSYGPSFFPFAYGPSAKRAGHKLKGKTRIRNLQYGPRNEVSKIFIISLRLIGRAEKEIFKVSGPYSKVRPAILTNHSVRTN